MSNESATPAPRFELLRFEFVRTDPVPVTQLRNGFEVDAAWMQTWPFESSLHVLHSRLALAFSSPASLSPPCFFPRPLFRPFSDRSWWSWSMLRPC